MKTKLVLAAILVAAMPLVRAHGTIFVLKNGNRLEGSIVEEDDETIKVKLVRGGVVSLRRGDIEQIIQKPTAIEHFRSERKKLAPDDVAGRMKLAEYCLREAAPPLDIQAAELYREVIKLKPDHAEARRKLREVLDRPAKRLWRDANRLYKQKAVSDARDKLFQIVQYYRESGYSRDAEHMIAQTYLDQNRLDEARKHWLEALKADRYRVECYLGIIEVCERTRKWGKAVEIIDGVVAFAKDGELKRTLAARQAVFRQLEKLQQQSKEQPDNAEVHLAMAELLTKLDRRKMALSEMEKAAELGVQDANSFKALAEYYEDALDVAKAVRYWQLAREADLGGPIGRLAAKRLPRLDLRALIPKYLVSQNPEERENIIEQLEKSDLPFSMMEAVARKGRPYEDQPTGISDGSFDVPREDMKAEYSIFVPSSYTPERRWPAILALHGQGSSGANYVYLWAEQAEKAGIIIIAPTAPPAGWNELGRRNALKTLHKVRAEYNIDPDRVFVSGTSIGAEAAWQITLHYPHLFAGMVSRSGRITREDQLYLHNALHVPIYIVHGGLDFTYAIADMRDVHKRLKKLDCEHVFHERKDGRHGPFLDENEPIIEWLADRRRPP